MRDYLGANAIFNGSSFIMMFRISRTRFQRMMEDTAALEKPFYSETTSCNCLQVASFEARLLLPLKCLAYGVPPHTFMDYFQMSKTLAAKACIVFDEILHEVYHGEYLRSPTSQDLQIPTICVKWFMVGTVFLGILIVCIHVGRTAPKDGMGVLMKSNRHLAWFPLKLVEKNSIRCL